MSEPKEGGRGEGRPVPAEGDVGDVETAGETTAASAIRGPTDNRPVGADTLVEVAETPSGEGRPKD